MPEITRLISPEPREFLEEFVAKGRPAVISGCMDWPVMQVDATTLIDENKQVYVSEDSTGLFGPGHYRKIPLRFGELLRKWRSDSSGKTYYMDQQPIDKVHPELLGLIGYPDFIEREHLVAVNLWMGAGRLRWHFDGVDNFLAHIHGRKRVRLMPPEALPHLYVFGSQWSAINDIENIDYGTFPLAKGLPVPHDTVLEKGDMLFIPAAWWHTTASIGSWGASINYWYQTWYGMRKSEFARPFFSAIEHLTHLLSEEVPTAERLHYCQYAMEMISRIARGHALPARAKGGWDNPRRIDYTPVGDRVPPAFPDAPEASST